MGGIFWSERSNWRIRFGRLLKLVDCQTNTNRYYVSNEQSTLHDFNISDREKSLELEYYIDMRSKMINTVHFTNHYYHMTFSFLYIFLFVLPRSQSGAYQWKMEWRKSAISCVLHCIVIRIQILTL